MEILRATPDDAAILTGIAFAAKRHWGYPERWIVQWRHLLTIDPCLIAEQPTYAAHVGSELVGFYALGRGGPAMSLEHLWVLPSAMGRGVGRELFFHAVERAKEFGIQTLKIESDPHAAGFYERMGAIRVGATITKIEGQPRELPILHFDIDAKTL